MFGYRDFEWKGEKLMRGTRNTGVKIIPDAMWPQMYRVEYPSGTISDMANLSRAKDAAIGIIAHYLNREARAVIKVPNLALGAMQGLI